MRRFGQRLLHPFRRASARSRVGRLPSGPELLVLCYGNICRSPYAVAVLAERLRAAGKKATLTQGGFFGDDRPSPDAARRVAGSRGVDLAGHRSRLLTSEAAGTATLIVVMEAEQVRRVYFEFGVPPTRTLILGDLDPDLRDGRDILDPYGLSDDTFARTYDRIDRCVRELVEALPAR